MRKRTLWKIINFFVCMKRKYTLFNFKKKYQKREEKICLKMKGELNLTIIHG